METKKEIWKTIKGYEKLYIISNFGRFYAYSKIIVGRDSSSKPTKAMYLTPFESRGYKYINLSNNNKKIKYRVNRLVALHFIPNPENKPFVNHIDGNKLNNNATNLEWCTHAENMNHASKTKLMAYGEKHFNTTLSDKQVKQIRKLYVPFKYTASMLAKEYNVSRRCISSIVNLTNRTLI